MSDEEYSDECPCTNVIEENALLICQDCGNVVRDVPDFRWDVKCVDQKDFNRKMMLKKSSDFLAPSARITESVLNGLKLIGRLANLLNLSSNIAKAACDTLKTISKNEVFKHRQTQSKQCLAIWCLYLISRKHGSALSLSQISGACDIVCEIRHLSSVYTLLRTHFTELSSYVDIMDLVEIPLEDYNYDDKEKRKIINLTRELVELFQKAALVQGYNPVFVIEALAYLAWKTQDSPRLNTNYRKYCDILSIQFCSTVSQNIYFYTKMLKELYKCSPEFVDQPNLDKIILVKIPDVLRTKNITVYNFNKSHPNHIAKKRSYKKSNENTQPVLYDEDFSDSEIEQYLKSKEEIKASQKMSLSKLEN